MALEADPISAFGGVLAFNRELDRDTALEVSKLFAEAIAAPAFSSQALEILTSQEEPAPSEGHADRETGGRYQIDFRRSLDSNSGFDHPRFSFHSCPNHPPTDAGGKEGAALCMEGLQAREIKRYRLRARRADNQRRALAR